jgi:ATP-dependent Clp protease ATP-binding subunit ClpX
VLTLPESPEREALRRILTEPKNAIIKQYEKLFDMDGIKLTWDKKVLDYIVQKAMEFKLGARGLRSICEAIMMDAMFELPSKENRGRNHHRDQICQGKTGKGQPEAPQGSLMRSSRKLPPM